MKKYCVFIFLLYSFISFAQPVIVLDSISSIQKIGKSLYLLEDPTGLLTAEQIAGPKYKSEFLKSAYIVPSFNVTKSAIWAHFRIYNNTRKDNYILIDPPNLRNISLYKNTDGKFTETKTGYFFPLTGRRILTNHFFFLIDAEKDISDYYMRVTNIEPLKFNVQVGGMQWFLESIQREDMFNCFIFGLMVMMILYNLYLYFTNLDKIYIYYVFFVFFSLLFINFFAGYFIYFPQWFLSTFTNFTTLIPVGLGIFSILFTIRFLNTRQLMPFIHKLFLGLAFFLIIILVTVLSGFNHEGIILIEVAGMLLGIVSIVAGLAALKKGYAPAKFYLVGFGVYMLGLMIFIIAGLNALPPNEITLNSLQFGSAGEVVMLSFALGAKMNILQKEKDKAKEQAILASLENEKLVREQNSILEEKVIQRTDELAQKNKDITDSINYAKRIQLAILPNEEDLDTCLQNHFVLYKPKDIVSGDFYWCKKITILEIEYDVVAAVDCTGHGVPGAFMSILGNNLLDQAFMETTIQKPADVLNFLNKELPTKFKLHGKESTIQDGMDITLCFIDRKNKKLFYSGAHNPLWTISGANKFLETKANKQGISASEDLLYKFPFTTNEIELQTGDTFYLFTDGYADQFGGPSKKKFRYKQLQDLLISINGLTMAERKNKLDVTITDWRGNLEQVDDILIIGVKI